MTRVAVTGAGGAAGIAVIRELRGQGHAVLALDGDAWATGLRLADASLTIPRADSESFGAAIGSVLTSWSAQALISTVAEELKPLATLSLDLANSGVATWLPSVHASEMCNDKWLFAEALRAQGVPHPLTSLDAESAAAGPWVVKPRRGRGSRDVSYVSDPEVLTSVVKAMDGNAIVQTQLLGREFTADTLTDRSGHTLCVVPRWRVETKAGISTKGETFANTDVVDAVEAALKAVGHEGPGCVQGFVTDEGQVSIMEINPRFSGGLPLSLAAGADLVGQYLRMILGDEPQASKLTYRSGVRMYRYYDAVFEYPETLDGNAE